MEKEYNYEYFKSSQFYQEIRDDMDKLLEKAFNKGFLFACNKFDKAMKELKDLQTTLDSMENR